MSDANFENITLVSCGTLSPELNHLKKEGFLEGAKIVYTTPGLHQDCRDLERQLTAAVAKAREQGRKVIVIYGGKFCYVNTDEPTRTMQKIVDEMGDGVVRIQATHCMDMLASEEERAALENGEKVWWMTPGWVEHWELVFKGWDKSVANENFPRHTGGAMVLDGIGVCDKYLNENPEMILERSDWMGIPMMGVPVTLDRLKGLLLEARDRL